MKARTLFILFIVGGVSISLYYIFQGGGSEQSYIDEINKERKDKDEFMRNAEDSPMPQKESFKGLNYFPPDPRYRIHANLTPVAQKEIVSLTTNDGKSQSYLTYAWAEFDLDNLHHRLLILEVTEEGAQRGSLFLAFADQTSANETYGAGRYLDVKKVPGAGTILLDFNNAYNPYCAYSEKYTCPFPPKENILKSAIRAGEKIYKK
jgi:uncharacterized protein (DUF1684 family)